MLKLSKSLVSQIPKVQGTLGKVTFSSSYTRQYSVSADEETKHFNHLAASWWDINGPQRILHKMNLVRMDFIQQNITNSISLNDKSTPQGEEVYVPGYNLNLLPKEISEQILSDQKEKRTKEYEKLQLRCLDIGCGGGILSESLARLPIVKSVNGLDLASEVVEIARKHKDLDPIIKNKITYELKALESVNKDEMYDVVTMFEILEHVDQPGEFLKEGLSHLKKDGLLFLSTINKDFVSWFTTIFMGEYMLGIVPVGTHHLEKYIDYKTLDNLMGQQKRFEVLSAKGGSYFPCYGWYLHSHPEFGNYFMAIKRIE
ncbi:hexaprenyldihydroxybenzoate methyltransferase [Saccharomycopsis crataegensis]|uniref:Ubiquinone biosynthesis O-methyltransferase, mitochondrial n=1 Tax=Saccharomycopsis crataegensis TaxID=43959 RepID=A0AAV5QJP0_9ASCO|nr:hexaprenyldihydroxybenzoate methyltransferase [Saccharomycopsis crataegensis]